MTVTITGGKYATATLSAAGTATVSVSGTPFSAGDFSANTPRIIGLWNSAGTALKGMAYVRRYLSTSQLELETAIFDPLTGAVVAQAIGDRLLVSKNWADVATTGIEVSQNQITLTDNINFGTSSVQDSLCFYDEDRYVRINWGSTAAMLSWFGGLWVDGHLQDFANETIYGGSDISLNTTTANFTLGIIRSTAASVCKFGGRVQAVNPNTANTWFGGASGNAGGAVSFSDANLFHMMRVEFRNVDVLSPGATPWANGAKHRLTNCSYRAVGTNAILIRWSNGDVRGGLFKIPNGSTAPISVTGGDGNGTYTFGAPASQRAIVLDIGGVGGASSGNTLWRTNTNWVQTLNFTNLLSSDHRAGFGVAPENNPNTSSSFNFFFRDNFSNVQSGSALGLIRNEDWALVDSVASASVGVNTLQLLHRAGSGHTVTVTHTTWTARIRKYGLAAIQTPIVESDYPLGTAGTAKNVSFGGVVNQLANPDVTLSASAAQAVAGVSVIDHGGSPVIWQSKSWGITVVGNLTTNPSLTANQIWHHLLWGTSQATSFNGKAGLLWHGLLDRNGTLYTTSRGLYAAVQKGVRIVDETGNAFPGVVSMQADDGSVYTPPLSVTYTVGNLVTGSRVLIRRTDTQAVLANVSVSGTSYAYSYQYAGSNIPVELVVRNSSGSPSYLEWRTTASLGAVDSGVNANQIQE